VVVPPFPRGRRAWPPRHGRAALETPACCRGRPQNARRSCAAGLACSPPRRSRQRPSCT
jgi:hypothetical protein